MNKEKYRESVFWRHIYSTRKPSILRRWEKEKMLLPKYPAGIANIATLVKPLNGTMRENHNIRDPFEIKMKIMEL